MIPAPSFLAYTPVSLTFGTSGLRGLVEDITDLEAYVNVKGAIRHLLGTDDIAPRSVVVIAGDLRPSTDRIMRACVQAIVDCGCEPENAGKVPTPALIFHAISARRAGVMVSGSHIPFDRNGIKLSRSAGEILKSDEPGITAEVERVRAEEYGKTAASSAFDSAGMLKRALDLPPVARAAEEAYVRRYLTSFPSGALSGQRLLVYQHSAVGRDILARILSELGAHVVTGGRTETFIPIDTENVTREELDHLEDLAETEGGGSPIHAIVSTDGDSDRPLVAAVLRGAEAERRARVRFLPGDLLGIVAAEYMGADAAAVPISANDAVDRRMRERGVLLRKTKIGSPYVVSAIDELRRTGAHARVVGWEANGGFLMGSDMAFPGGTMAALPTRDATLPILANLIAAAEQRIDLPTLWNLLPPRFGRAGLVDGVPAAVGRAILDDLIAPGDTIEVAFDGSGRVLDCSRPDVAPASLQKRDAAAWQARRATLARIFTVDLGFDDIVRMNVLDGVRIHFRNGDVAHVRPSGNAPQLRIYANSDSQARADQIVDLSLREPDGIVLQLVRQFSR